MFITISTCTHNQEGKDCHEQIIKRIGEGIADTNGVGCIYEAVCDLHHHIIIEKKRTIVKFDFLVA